MKFIFKWQYDWASREINKVREEGEERREESGLESPQRGDR